MNMKASEFLGQARDRLNSGWCKNRGLDDEGNVCAVGALTMTSMGHGIPLLVDNPAADRAIVALDDIARELGFRQIVHMNDHEDTTKQDMLNVFDKAIIGLEEQGL